MDRSIPSHNEIIQQKGNTAHSSEINNREIKPDSLDIRAVTSSSRGRDNKRQKYRMNVTKSSTMLFGSKFGPNSLEQDKLPTNHLFIDDPRASNLSIDFKNDQFHCMPSSERFSAHTGICQVLGSKNIKGGRFHLQVGDIVRFGSVGLLITEIDTKGKGQCDASMSKVDIDDLIKQVATFDDEDQRDFDSGGDTDDENIGQTVEEDSAENEQDTNEKRGDLSHSLSTSPLCYICYDDENDNENPLVAPCKCSGDTKFIHLDCLKRWNTGGSSKNEICAILDKTNLRECSICKSAYPSSIKLPNGKSVSLLPDKLDGPSITFVVITKHSSSNMTLNVKYQLSVKSLLKLNSLRPLLVGRSSQCDLILKYRTVSTVHAEIHYVNGEFYLQDVGSSNGTLRFIYRPLTLTVGQPVHLKFGRTVVSLKAKRRLRLASFFSGFSNLSVNSNETSNTTNS